MTDSAGLIDLQKQQKKHDEEHHRDIDTLPYSGRMNHYVLHFAKYVGRLARNHFDDVSRGDHLEKTLADSFIVALAAANTLNIDLQSELEKKFGPKAVSIAEWAHELDQTDDTMALEELQDWLFKQLATPTGRMSNAMESLDHMEPMNTREILEECIVEIVSILLISAENLESDIEELLNERWAEIEKESIL